MKFSTRQDIEAPIDFVFSTASDFDGFERQGMRRGVEVSREDPTGVPGKGSKWKIRGNFRGKPRNFRAEITEFDPPVRMCVHGETGGLSTEAEVEFVELAPSRTRMTVKMELKPVSLTGRLLVQSLKFAKSSLNGRMSKRAGDFAKSVEKRYGEWKG